MKRMTDITVVQYVYNVPPCCTLDVIYYLSNAVVKEFVHITL